MMPAHKLTDDRGEITAMAETNEELSSLYDEEYYRSYRGPAPSTRAELPEWGRFFGNIAEELIRALQPKRVLDAGCALGFLVQAFWDRGVEAWGIDISRYAISQVRRDLQPYCRAGSIVDGIEGKYDLITCIDVLEHILPPQAIRAIENLTRATDIVAFSSTPYETDEQRHFNVRPLIYWLKLFRERGFAPDLGFDLTFISDHAILFRRARELYSDEVLQLYARFVGQRHEILARDSSLREHTEQIQAAQARLAALELDVQELTAARQQIRALESAHQEIQVHLEAANRYAEELIQNRIARDSGPLWSGEVGPLGRAGNATLKMLEFRIAGLEEQYARLSHSVRGILESRIWRTLVRAGAIIQKIVG